MVKKAGSGVNIAVVPRVRTALESNKQWLNGQLASAKKAIAQVITSSPTLQLNGLLHAQHHDKLEAAAQIEDPVARQTAIVSINNDLRVTLSRVAKAKDEFRGTYGLSGEERVTAQTRILNQHFGSEPELRLAARDYFLAQFGILNLP